MYLDQKNIRIGISTIKNAGYGVFTEQEIKKEEVICSCPLLQIYDTSRDDYYFTIENKLYIALGFGSLFNHSDDFNVFCSHQNGLLIFYAHKDILSDSELFLNYGEYYNMSFIKNDNNIK